MKTWHRFPSFSPCFSSSQCGFTQSGRDSRGEIPMIESVRRLAPRKASLVVLGGTLFTSAALGSWTLWPKSEVTVTGENTPAIAVSQRQPAHTEPVTTPALPEATAEADAPFTKACA